MCGIIETSWAHPQGNRSTSRHVVCVYAYRQRNAICLARISVINYQRHPIVFHLHLGQGGLITVAVAVHTVTPCEASHTLCHCSTYHLLDHTTSFLRKLVVRHGTHNSHAQPCRVSSLSYGMFLERQLST